MVKGPALTAREHPFKSFDHVFVIPSAKRRIPTKPSYGIISLSFHPHPFVELQQPREQNGPGVEAPGPDFTCRISSP
ncbi:hypothetical protein MPL3365_40091 [Mesorhizobium plurifarium]|uniref:Uncharacterized protein n=1 Tax=Mesorhizobium plurifarium TaxID=69974 RepID=A0A090GA31_MESPL|nr:hypothetical protein MPL3365_40091 [Mesorhizobium plurifarium]